MIYNADEGRHNSMASVFDTAHYILEQYGRMSTMKLQKLCYYAQAWSLVWDDAPLFDEDFEAWANGPICVVLFQKYKGRFDLTAEDILDGDSARLSDAQKETVNAVLEHYGPRDAQYLSRLTHMEDPWIEARNGYAPGERCNVIITKDSMAMYYGGLD